MGSAAAGAVRGVVDAAAVVAMAIGTGHALRNVLAVTAAVVRESIAVRLAVAGARPVAVITARSCREEIGRIDVARRAERLSHRVRSTRSGRVVATGAVGIWLFGVCQRVTGSARHVHCTTIRHCMATGGGSDAIDMARSHYSRSITIMAVTADTVITDNC